MSEKKSKVANRLNRNKAHIPNYTQIRERPDGTWGPVTAGTMDCRLATRASIEEAIKDANGDMSKYIPAKYGYGGHGAQKY